MDRGVYVYDIETLKSCFTYSAINIDTEEIVKYVIHKDTSDIAELFDHLHQCKGQIGFNNINFDYPILHYILKKGIRGCNASDNIVLEIYNEAQG